jgi:hypothetical protein
MQPDKDKAERHDHKSEKQLDSANTKPSIPDITHQERDAPAGHAERHTPPLTNEPARIRWLPPTSGWDWDTKLRLFDGLLTIVSFLGLLFLGYQSCQIYRTNTIAENIMRIDQRAWLSFSFGALTVNANDGSYKITLPVNNTGKTPAYRTRFRLHGIISDSAPTPEDVNSGFTKTPYGYMGVIFPAEQVREPLVFTKHPDRADFDAFTKGTLRLFVTAEVRYCDAFGQVHSVGRCAHRTRLEETWTYCGSSTDTPRTDTNTDKECEGPE